MITKRSLLALLLSCLIVAIIPAVANAGSVRTTLLFSKSYNGGAPNGESRNGAISADQRFGRIMAYDSDASNIVRGDNNIYSDIFMVQRKSPYASNGTFWRGGDAKLISEGMNNNPSNGNSYLPDIDGDAHGRPRCIAYLSDASNLVSGDTNGKRDAFLYSVHTGNTTRLSLDNNRNQYNVNTTSVSIDGNCRRVALTIGDKVYLRNISSRKNLTIGDGANAHIARDRAAIAYERNGQIYRTWVSNKGKSTVLASKNSHNQAGNDDSVSPNITYDGHKVSFSTDATNLIRRVKHSTIVQANLRNPSHVRLKNASRSIDGIANGESHNPVMTEAGEFIFYDSDATNLRPARSVILDPNRLRDVFLWNEPTAHVSLESRNYANKYVEDEEGRSGKPSDERSRLSGSFKPATSAHGNYLMFESANPNFDRSINNNSGYSQVYLRYMGPK